MTLRLSKMTFAALLAAMLAFSCAPERDAWIDSALAGASVQLKATADTLRGEAVFPRTVWSTWDIDFLAEQLDSTVYQRIDYLRAKPSLEKVGKLRTGDACDWTAGFFPGSLWLAYELTGDERLRDDAVEYTNAMLPATYIKGTHDLGFMVGCSYGNAWRVAPDDSIKTVLLRSADNLVSRFNPAVGAIRSWDFGPWNYPVIIDNMMNLELLFLASKISGDTRYRDVAVSHADKTMANHFRPDYTSWHVVSYNNDGTVEKKQTYQGRSDDSAWARGQAWGVYGYTVCYRETGEARFLEQARHIADTIMSMVQTDDLVPYWDYCAPVFPDTPRDASAAAVTASAFLELCCYVSDGERYRSYAKHILRSPGTYMVKVEARGEERRVWKLENDEGEYVQNQHTLSSHFEMLPLGWIHFSSPGKHRVTLSMPEGGKAEVSAISLVPVKF